MKGGQDAWAALLFHQHGLSQGTGQMETGLSQGTPWAAEFLHENRELGCSSSLGDAFGSAQVDPGTS